MKNKLTETRREFIRKSSLATVAAIAVPTIVPASVFGKNAPSNRINVGMIGTGRQAISANLKNGFLKLDNCHFLKVEGEEGWKEKIEKSLSYLKMVSINGADGGDTQNMGEGRFDTYKLESPYRPGSLTKRPTAPKILNLHHI